jgi:hypothetical protein
MNLILYVLSGLLGLVVLLLIVAALAKKEYSVMREIAIKKSRREVFDYLKYLKNQNKFSKWATMDPNMKQEFRGTDGTVGFVSAWDSDDKNVGKGEQEIMKIKDGERIDFELRFIKPFPGLAKAYLITESLAPDTTMVKWGFDSKMNFPMNLMLLFMNMDKMIGNDFEIGLARLKKLLEG